MADQLPTDPYGAEYQDQMFQKLAPQVEAMVMRMFPNVRGAKFGAQGSILAKRLANLKLEIALDSAKRGAAQTEQLRREAVSKQLDTEKNAREQGEKLRVENENRNRDTRYMQWHDTEQRAKGEAESAAKEQAFKDQFYDPKAPDLGKGAYEKALAYRKSLQPPEQPGLFDSMKQWWQGGESSPSAATPDTTPSPDTADFGTRGQVGFDNRIDNPDFKPIPRSFKDAYQFGPDTNAPPLAESKQFGGSDRASADVAPAGGFSVAGPGTTATSTPAGTWERTNIPQLPGVNVGWRDRGGNLLTEPGGSNIATMPEPRSPWDKNYTDPGGMKQAATAKINSEIKGRTLPDAFSGKGASGGFAATPGSYVPSGTGYTDTYNRDLWSGKVDQNSFTTEPAKWGRDVKNTARGFWQGLSSIFS